MDNDALGLLELSDNEESLYRDVRDALEMLGFKSGGVKFQKSDFKPYYLGEQNLLSTYHLIDDKGNGLLVRMWKTEMGVGKFCIHRVQKYKASPKAFIQSFEQIEQSLFEEGELSLTKSLKVFSGK